MVTRSSLKSDLQSTGALEFKAVVKVSSKPIYA